MKRFFTALIFGLFITELMAEDLSSISLPVTLRLGNIEAYANQQIPRTLDHRRHGQRCVKPELACTKIPEFRGLKVTFKNRCVEVTPAIDCDIEHKVWRDGRLTLSTERNALVLQQTVAASATVRGRGEIGRHIRETVNGAARFKVVARPEIRSDWSMSLPLDVSFRWVRRPEARLFGFIPISFGSEAERAITRAIQGFKANELPEELRKHDLRRHVAALWADLQRPHRIDVPNSLPLFLHIRPEAIGMTGPSVVGENIVAQASIAAKLRLTDSVNSPFGGVTSSLPNLTRARAPGLSITLPVSIQSSTLTAHLSKDLPRAFDVPSLVPGKLKIYALRTNMESGQLVIYADVSAEVRGIGTGLHRLKLSARPAWNAAIDRLEIQDLALSAGGNAVVRTALSGLLQTPAVARWLEAELNKTLSRARADARRALNAALNRPVSQDLKLEADLSEQVKSIEFSNDLRLNLHIGGTARITGFAMN